MRPAVLMLLYLVTVIVAVAALVALCWALVDWAISPLPYNDPEPKGAELLMGGLDGLGGFGQADRCEISAESLRESVCGSKWGRR